MPIPGYRPPLQARLRREPEGPGWAGRPASGWRPQQKTPPPLGRFLQSRVGRLRASVLPHAYTPGKARRMKGYLKIDLDAFLKSLRDTVTDCNDGAGLTPIPHSVPLREHHSNGYTKENHAGGVTFGEKAMRAALKWHARSLAAPVEIPTPPSSSSYSLIRDGGRHVRHQAHHH